MTKQEYPSPPAVNPGTPGAAYPWDDWLEFCWHRQSEFRAGDHFRRSLALTSFRSAARNAARTRGLDLETHLTGPRSLTLEILGHTSLAGSARRHLEQAQQHLEDAGNLLGATASPEMGMTGTLALQLAAKTHDALNALEEP